MAFVFATDPTELIDERTAQWVNIGADPLVVETVRGRVKSLWGDRPGDWAHEWSAAARKAERDGDLFHASILYGIGKFPVLGDDAHRAAYDNQLRTYLAAAPGFEVGFERHFVDVSFRGSVTQVATHLYLPDGLPDDAPLLLVLSGVDTWKVEVHRTALNAARGLGARVATVDMAGTGESKVANGPDGDLYLAGVLDWMRKRYPAARKAGSYGFSFAGHWSTKLALTRQVDAAVSVGGLVADAFEEESVRALRYGMPGIFGNSLRLDSEPDLSVIVDEMAKFSLWRQGLMDDWGPDPVPLLSVNGDKDQHVPTTDVTVLEDRPNTIARLIPDATHCAPEALGEVIPWTFQWLAKQLA
ncbi:alpha/beta hydrolase [Streptomyces sp. NPDC090493]|uniref:alpha/beta hydrolase n=1 Tax=Streptomyces sp. NPDC090493 TaxID=3365964 RepID=UPI00380D17BA